MEDHQSPIHHILVVEEDPSPRQLNTRLLQRSGYAVHAALSADEYDLMIADHTMPKASDVELVGTLRATPKALPVILTTDTRPQREISRYPWLRPSAMLLKPHTAEKLLGTVKDVLRKSGSLS